MAEEDQTDAEQVLDGLHHDHLVHGEDIGVDEKNSESVEAAVEDYISEAAAAAIHAVADTGTEAGTSAAVAAAAAAAAAVINADGTVAALAGGDVEDDDNARRNQERRKRYRETKIDDKGEPKEPKSHSHETQLAARRLKDRQRYAAMTPEQRHVYNAKRREQYHRQSEGTRVKRRERERRRYHALDGDKAKGRNARRARLERERYHRMTPEELEAKNRRRRERAALARQKKDAAVNQAVAAAGTAEAVAMQEEHVAGPEDDIVRV